MPPSLLDLQPELQLIIADAIVPDYTGLGDNDVRQKYNENGISPPTRDAERRDREKESRMALVNWSSTSRFFRALLTPYKFKTIVLRNDEKNAASVKAIAQHPEYGKLVRELQFVGHMPSPRSAEQRHPIVEVDAYVLPEDVQTLLADLRQFPHLEFLSVEFAYTIADYDDWEEGVNTADFHEEEGEVELRERAQPWRALMARVWEAICRNEGGVVKKLMINNLYYKQVTTFTTLPFQKFLNNIQEINLSIYGGDNGACWHTNTCEVWQYFVGKLDTFFFDHLQNVTSLTLKATRHAPLGLEGMNHAQLPLRKDHMPLLKNVHFEWIFIGPELRDFLVGHTSTLEHVHLRNGLAETDTGMSDDGIHWFELFDAISSAKPGKLHTFKVTEDSPAPLPNGMGDLDDGWEGADEGEIEAEISRMREKAESGEARVWAHITVDDKYGMLFEDEESNLASMREGKDQDAWERLMDVVRRNGGDGGIGGWGANLTRFEKDGREYSPYASRRQVL